MAFTRVGGSLRDPAGYVVRDGRRVLRVVRAAGRRDYEAVRATGLLEILADRGWLLPASEVDHAGVRPALDDCHYLLEHPPIRVVSYPYEWTFAGLRAAALLHLDIHLAALARGCTLKDASAFNVQFRGTRPVFCDVLSLVPYENGSLWTAHRQFCEQFLNPLLLTASLGIPFQPWYRGGLDGIPVTDICRVVPRRGMLSPRMLVHVFAQGWLQSRLDRSLRPPQDAIRRGRLDRAALVRMLSGLRRWIASLRPRRRESVWAQYDRRAPYSDHEAGQKSAFVARWVQALRPGTVLDLGCNTGAFSRLALEAGAGYVVGLDGDASALEDAFQAADRDGLPFLPLQVDVANPTPGQGWRGGEREALTERVQADLVLALAVVHHLVITRALPVSEVVAAVLSLAPHAIIEFVPPEDEAVRRMTALTGRVPEGYGRLAFEEALERSAEIVDRLTVSASGRTLFAVARRP